MSDASLPMSAGIHDSSVANPVPDVAVAAVIAVRGLSKISYKPCNFAPLPILRNHNNYINNGSCDEDS
jgi:hypothetical protein